MYLMGTVVTIQQFLKRRLPALRYRKYRKAIIKLQAQFRMKQQRKKYLALLEERKPKAKPLSLKEQRKQALLMKKARK